MNFNGRTNVVSECCVDQVAGSYCIPRLVMHLLRLLLLLNKWKGIFHILYVIFTHLSATTCWNNNLLLVYFSLNRQAEVLSPDLLHAKV